MRFIDECTLRAEAGHGGHGAIAFRREKYVPLGGPAGGDGGKGGDVVFVGDAGQNTLLSVTHLSIVRAESGAPGSGKDRHGKSGKNHTLRVPLGTIVYDADTDQLLCEVLGDNQAYVIARGGEGGRGNKHFTSSVNRAPRKAEPGKPGATHNLRLVLKVMADVGIIGFPNVGKSTLIRALSHARPKVADYPFTTLVPSLGVVSLDLAADEPGETFVLADIPGLIPGASSGAGLGIRFLKHVERSKLLLHLVSLRPESTGTLLDDYHTIMAELRSFDPALADRPCVVALSKADLPEVRRSYSTARALFAAEGIELGLISAATHEGLEDLKRLLFRRLQSTRSAATETSEAAAASEYQLEGTGLMTPASQHRQ